VLHPLRPRGRTLASPNAFPALVRTTFTFSEGKSYIGPTDFGINCTSTDYGLMCSNEGGHGFELRRSRQRIFSN
jgi:hypothetical protein